MKRIKKSQLLALLSIGVILLGIIYSCTKGGTDNSSRDDLQVDQNVESKFAKNQWPTFMISKENLTSFFVGDNFRKTMTIVLRSEIANFKNTLQVVGFTPEASLDFKQDAKETVEINNKISIVNNVIHFDQILAICRANGQWIDNFEFLRLTPIESTLYPGYLAFNLSAHDKDGKIIQSLSLRGTGEDLSHESNPSPPHCCQCPDHMCSKCE